MAPFLHSSAARLCAALLLAASAAASPADSMLSLVGSIALPGVTDAAVTMKMDHSALVGGLLFLACKENNTVAVVDLDAGAFVASVPVPFPQGVARSAALGLVFVASSTAGTLTAMSAAPPFAVAWSLPIGGDCDNIPSVVCGNGVEHSPCAPAPPNRRLQWRHSCAGCTATV